MDAAVTAAAPLYRQLMAAYAEESATEDAIYFLGEGLNRGVIDCETYLKHVRNLSRKQFLLRNAFKRFLDAVSFYGVLSFSVFLNPNPF